MIFWLPKTVRLASLALSQTPALTEAEFKLLCAATIAQIAYCGPNQDDGDPDNNPDFGANWGSEREIRAGLIRWLCIDPEAVACIDPGGIVIHGARIRGLLELSFLTVPFPLTLMRCFIPSEMHLMFSKISGLQLMGTVSGAIRADGIEVRGDFRLVGGFRVNGEIDLRGAVIGGNLGLLGGTLANNGGDALRADRARISGGFVLRERINVSGAVDLDGANIGGELDCTTGTFTNIGGDAIVADGVVVNSGVFLRECTAVGGIRLVRARIGANLECDGSTLSAPGGFALTADGVQVGGDVFLRGQFSADGAVRLLGAEIVGDLQVSDGRFARGSSFHAQGARVRRRFFWRDLGPKVGVILNLNHASVGVLSDAEESWPTPGNLNLDGFVFSRFARSPTDAARRLRWLALQNSEDPPWYSRIKHALFYGGIEQHWRQTAWPEFRPQPFQQVAKVLQESGDYAGARRVLIEMENSRRKFGSLNWRAWLWRWILWLTIRYGYKPWQAMYCGLIIVGLGWLLFSQGYAIGAITPTDKEAFRIFETYHPKQHHGEPPRYYPRFSAAVYSLDAFLPIINFGQKDHWMPNPNEGACGELLRRYLWFHVALGWLLTTLFVAGLTPLVRSG